MSGSKIKSAIAKKAHKNAQAYNSAEMNGNKEIADFICTKERSDFHARGVSANPHGEIIRTRAIRFAKIASLFCKYKIGNFFVFALIC